ncbi:hypothetical protein BOTBODRAFT_472998 [Botryobasidium botryosum FD-172 SS1]|uniref:Uncharacterized protein n=1 Tax=Botryobasidium botryosum (strain FD-172 SS1) TaxID=930990 RepID=A0A067M4Q6_BOTB1|nr:hypothetical protein BOTBODRAFT_472998 [Botryobasidium botryosum FD-172 SS1]
MMEAFIPRVQQLMLDLVGNMTAESSGPKIPREPAEDNCERPDACPKSLKRELQILAEARDFAVEVIKRFMESKIVKLASRHNHMVAISFLPNEVLSIIFEHAHTAAVADADSEGADDEIAEDTEEKRDASLHFGLRASHVSTLWRHIAISTPCLWTCIDTPVLRFVDACLSRSKGLPLDIVFQKPLAATLADRVQYEERVKGCIPSLLTHIERWRSLPFWTSSPRIILPSSLFRQWDWRSFISQAWLVTMELYRYPLSFPCSQNRSFAFASSH